MQFKDIIGQEKIKQRLIQTVKDNRISHAQLFLGPEGSEKLALAIAYAQYINCENKQDGDSCGVCPSCIKYNKLIHPDLHFIYPVANTKDVPEKPVSKNFIKNWRKFLIENDYHLSLNQWYKDIGIEKKQGIINADDCNEIIKTLSYKSYESEYKVMIIWMAERLYYSAAPKILKILEEPPDKTLFILVSENQDKIINTILSRTQLVKIPKLEKQDLLNALVSKYKINNKDAKRIVNLSNGNYIEALRLINSSEDEKYNYEIFTKWMRLCYKRDIIGINNIINSISKIGRERQKNFLNYALRIIRKCLLMNYSDENLILSDEEELYFIRNFSPFINSANCIQFNEEINKAIYHIERNANPSILFMDLSLTIIKLLKIYPQKISTE